jgi:hypothetical protein
MWRLKPPPTSQQPEARADSKAQNQGKILKNVLEKIGR